MGRWNKTVPSSRSVVYTIRTWQIQLTCTPTSLFLVWLVESWQVSKRTQSWTLEWHIVGHTLWLIAAAIGDCDMCEAFQTVQVTRRVRLIWSHGNVLIKSQQREVQCSDLLRDWHIYQYGNRRDSVTQVVLPNRIDKNNVRPDAHHYQSKSLSWFAQRGRRHDIIHNTDRDPETGRCLPAIMTLFVDHSISANFPLKLQLSWWTFGFCFKDWDWS